MCGSVIVTRCCDGGVTNLGASGIRYALRHDCGCGDLKASFVVYSDDHGATWTGGGKMVLLPQFGVGVLTSRERYFPCSVFR